MCQSPRKELFTCDDTSCNPYWINDGLFDASCMNLACNYDSDFVSKDKNEIFLHTDYFYFCNCNTTLLGNSQCDSECNSYECGWDLGDCGYCSSECFEPDLLGSD